VSVAISYLRQSQSSASDVVLWFPVDPIRRRAGAREPSFHLMR
jgi:hypothetical protein